MQKLIFSFLFMFSGLIYAGGLQVSPILIEMNTSNKVGSLWLSNDSTALDDEVINVQIRVYQWDQKENGEFILRPTTNLIASPPIAKVRSGDEQLIRIIRNESTLSPSENEESYRVIATQLPASQNSKSEQLSIVFEHSIPVFYRYDTQKPDPTLTFEIDKQAGSNVLFINNQSGDHATLTDIEFVSSNGKRTKIPQQQLGYVLPNKTVKWELNELSSGDLSSGGKFELKVNRKNKEYAVEIK